jgi:hypothetical protein
MFKPDTNTQCQKWAHTKRNNGKLQAGDTFLRIFNGKKEEGIWIIKKYFRK